MISKELYNQLFALCVWILEVMASFFGTTYTIINIWIFCFIGPAVFLMLFIGFLIQRKQKLKYKKLWQAAVAGTSSMKRY